MSPFDPSPPAIRKLKPGVAGYWIGGGLVLLGIVGAIVWFVIGLVGISNAVDDFERVPADGGGEVALDDDTAYVIYIEDRSTSRFASNVRVTLTDPSGGAVDVRNYGSEFNYDFGGRAGTALFTFRSGSAGEYLLASESSAVGSSLAVGPSLAGDLVWTIAMPFVIGGIGFLVGIILIIVTLVRRSGDKKRRDAGSRPTAPPGLPPTSPGFPPAPPGYPPTRGPGSSVDREAGWGR